jgi:hypothetical protein
MQRAGEPPAATSRKIQPGSDDVVAGAQETALKAPVLAMAHRLHRLSARVASHSRGVVVRFNLIVALFGIFATLRHPLHLHLLRLSEYSNCAQNAP